MFSMTEHAYLTYYKGEYISPPTHSGYYEYARSQNLGAQHNCAFKHHSITLLTKRGAHSGSVHHAEPHRFLRVQVVSDPAQ